MRVLSLLLAAFVPLSLAAAPDKPVPPDLLKALEDKEPAVRIKAIKALSKLGPEVVPPLVKALADEDAAVSQSAGIALRYFRADAKTALAALQPHLRDKNAAVRKGIVAALPRCGGAAALLLVERLADKDTDVRRQAALSLQFVLGRDALASKVALPGLEKALEDSSAGVRLAIVQALGRCGAGALRPLLKGADDDDAKVRANAIAGLIRIKPDAKAVLPVLTRRARNDPELMVRQSALRTLGTLGAPAVPALRDALSDADAAVQFAALKSLAAVGPAAKSALPAIKRAAAKAANASVRSGAVTVLARLGAEGETAIVELLGGNDSGLVQNQVAGKGRSG